MLDTNVLIAAFVARGVCNDVFRIVLAEHQLLTSPPILGELERVLLDKLRIPADRIDEIVAFVAEHAQLVAPEHPADWPESDPSDRWIVASALAGSADVLISGDKELVDSSRGRSVRVLTPRAFWKLLRKGD
ncbi:MAG: putative toxin-antitoxin system toxin component, PIN family [Gammaproteobacteria bacterium]|nr:putative toxin-antitoxin system toxin component, PIN family [Gammaproteobacteria bacterium]